MLWRIFKYIEHLFHQRHRQGHHIHSPYLFDFINGVVFNASRIEAPKAILDMHSQLRSDATQIPVGISGSGSNVSPSEKRSVGSFVKTASVSGKYGAMLYRITHWFQPEMILELGTGVGISTAYLAAGSPQTILHTIEANSERANFSSGVIKRCGLDEVKVHRGGFEQKLEEITPDVKERFVAFVDGNHHYEPTVEYVKYLVSLAGDEALIIMDDIYWSKGMQRAWKEIISWPEVRVSIDMFHMGILLLRKDLNKAHLKIKF
jgi:predicted O-methyltransferase YrrM